VHLSTLGLSKKFATVFTPQLGVTGNFGGVIAVALAAAAALSDCVVEHHLLRSFGRLWA
jgi:hypothetical protein